MWKNEFNEIVICKNFVLSIFSLYYAKENVTIREFEDLTM